MVGPDSAARGWPTESHARFVDQLRAVVQHGDLTDKAFVEKALGGRLVLQRETTSDGQHYPNATWLVSYCFHLEGMEYPVKPHFGGTSPKGSYSVWTLVPPAKATVELDFQLEDKSDAVCVTLADVASGFGDELPRGNPYNSTKPIIPWHEFQLSGANTIVTTASVNGKNGCVDAIWIRQNPTRSK